MELVRREWVRADGTITREDIVRYRERLFCYLECKMASITTNQKDRERARDYQRRCRAEFREIVAKSPVRERVRGKYIDSAGLVEMLFGGRSIA